MAKIFTPTLSVVSAGLLKNQGFSIPAELPLAANNFASLGLPTAISTLNELGPGPEVKEALASIPNYLTGIVPYSSRSSVPEELHQEFNFDNLISDIVFQANKIFSNGVSGLTSILPAAHSFCENSFNVLGSFKAIGDANFEDFGLTIENYNDVVTNGVGSQYINLAGGITSQSFRSMMRQVGNFGTMFDISRLDMLDDPRVLCQNLLNQGFYLIVDALANKGIDPAELFDTDKKLVLESLKSINGKNLSSIVSITNFSSHHPLFSLADVLDASRIFDSAALAAAGGSLKELSRRLSNIGGNFDSFKDLSDTYLSIESVNLPNLTSLSSVGPQSIFGNSFPELGSGVGQFDNPTVYDLLGSASRSKYISKINQLISIHSQIISTTAGQALIESIVAAGSDPTSVNSAVAIIGARDNLLNSQPVQNINQEYQAIFDGMFNDLLTERRNLSLAGIDLPAPSNNLQGLTSFVLELHRAYDDPFGLSYGNFIKELVTNDVYGDSILGAMAEGRNIALLNEKGVPNYTGIDPVSYAMSISRKPC